MTKRESIESAKVVARIRQLLKTHSISQTARIVGRSPASVHQIKHGQRHNNKKDLTINSLCLLRTTPGFKCRCCGNSVLLATKSLLCVECELFDLNKQGLIRISENK